MTSIFSTASAISGASTTNAPRAAQGGFDGWFDSVLESYSHAGKTQDLSAHSLLESSDGETSDLSYFGEDEALHTDLEDELSKWVNMSLGEKIRAQYLADHELTEDQLAAMPAEEREQIEAAIREYIEQNMKAITGAGKIDGAQERLMQPELA